MTNKKFFAAVNGADGFKSYFDELFFGEDVKRRYVIKGGAGTGKSTFLKTLAKLSESKGHDVELYYCSSDPSSLDAVVIRDLKICALDATSPHAYDCKYVGCVDTLLDITQFLSAESLFCKTDEIKTLIKKGESHRKSANKRLEAAGALARELYESGRGHVDMQRLEKIAARLTRNSIKKTKESGLRVVSAINANNKTSLTDYFSDARKCFYVEDKYVFGALLLKLVFEKAGGKVTAFIDPLINESFEAVYLEDDKILISAERLLLPESYVKIGTKNVYDDYFKENKAKLRLDLKLIKLLTDMACDELFMAKHCHDKLESINASAMDFEKANEWTHKVTEEILSYRKE